MATVALLAYEEHSRPLVMEVKSGRRSLVDLVAPALADLVLLKACELGWAVEPTLTWAPTSARRARARGRDQAALLATALNKCLRWPRRELLVRDAQCGPQQGRGAAQRRREIALSAVRSCSGPVVVVDDVITTGTTMSAAAACLVGAGADAVMGLALASAQEPLGADCPKPADLR